MGNRLTKKIAQSLLYKWGINSRLAYGSRGRHDPLIMTMARQIIRQLSFNPGDLVYDCDGFNHVICGLVEEYESGDGICRFWNDSGKNFRKLYNVDGLSIPHIPQFVFSDGTYSCRCSLGLCPPKTREEIEARVLSSLEKNLKLGCSFVAYKSERYQALTNGEHICDENGILLYEFRER